MKGKLGGSTLALFALTAALVVGNIYSLHSLKADFERLSYVAQGRTAYPLLYLATRLSSASGDTRPQIVSQLRKLIDDTDKILDILIEGGGASNLAAEQDPLVLTNLRQRQRLWSTQIRPLLERMIVADPGVSNPELRELDQLLRNFADQVDQGVILRQEVSATHLAWLQAGQAAFSAVVLLILLLVFWIARSVANRARELAQTADRISAGDLTLRAPVQGSDELALLGSSFNAMTDNLRSMIETEREGRAKLAELLSTTAETANSLSAAATEILAGTTQQATGMQQQSAAVAETVTTVDEVLQTSEQAAQRATAVSDSAQRAAEVSQAGRAAVENTITTMTAIKTQAAATAESILSLAERGQAIGEIVAAVTDIADQTNLLALNASIEASRAGEQGRGFSVVAAEIKALADQSKKATAQVRQILGDIQKGTTSAVIATEEGAKRIDQALVTISEGGSTIRALEHTITNAAQLAAQIAASAGQQATGMAQIQQAMVHINQASSQNLAATRQSEEAARSLHALGSRLKELLVGYGR